MYIYYSMLREKSWHNTGKRKIYIIPDEKLSVNDLLL